MASAAGPASPRPRPSPAGWVIGVIPTGPKKTRRDCSKVTTLARKRQSLATIRARARTRAYAYTLAHAHMQVHIRVHTGRGRLAFFSSSVMRSPARSLSAAGKPIGGENHRDRGSVCLRCVIYSFCKYLLSPYYMAGPGQTRGCQVRVASASNTGMPSRRTWSVGELGFILGLGDLWAGETGDPDPSGVRRARRGGREV